MLDAVIYAVQVGEDGPIKIGWCECIQKRLAALQRANPAPLRVVVTILARRIVEKHLQAFLRDHHLRGEWFHPAPEVLDALSHLKDGWRPPEGRFAPGLNPKWEGLEA